MYFLPTYPLLRQKKKIGDLEESAFIYVEIDANLEHFCLKYHLKKTKYTGVSVSVLVQLPRPLL